MQNTQKTIKELNLEDDFLFAKVMSDREICRQVLEKILDVPITEIVLPTTQRTIDILFEGKGIKLDVYVNDGNGTVYNVEMQRGKKRELPKRSRYYQGSLDLDLISAGEPYHSLRKTFIIFICTFDPFKDKRHLYTFENICRDKVTEVKQSKEMEVEYMTLLQRDRENIEMGREEGAMQAAKIIRLHSKGYNLEDIAASLNLDFSYVKDIIDNYEKDE